MKKILTIATLAIVAGIVALMMHRTSVEEPPIPAATRTMHSVAPPANRSAPVSGPAPDGDTPPSVPDPREQWLNALYESPSTADRLEAARFLAARGNETAFLDLATFVAAAEATGEAGLLELAREVASIVGGLHGEPIESIATEMAYSPSALVAEAAVNAVVPKDADPQAIESGKLNTQSEQAALDEYVQQLLQAEQ